MKPFANKAVVLFSGGLDSTTCLALAKNQGFDCFALSFSYGQKHSSELLAAKRIAAAMQVEHRIFNLDIGQFGGSALTDSNIPVLDHGDPGSRPSDVSGMTGVVPSTYVPARNTIFLSIALGYAEVLGARDIFIGVSAVDYSGYPDCRPEFIATYQAMANLATKDAVAGNSIKIHTPIISLSKAETIKLGLKLGVDYSQTVSCYRADSEGRACGKCDSCYLRKKGFNEADIKDNTFYQEKIAHSEYQTN